MKNLNKIIPICLLVFMLALVGCRDTSDNASDTPAAVDSATFSEQAVIQSTDSVRYHGIDVSHHQGDVDWEAVKAAGITFVYIKATEGNDYLDPKFQDNWKAVKEAGLVRGAYHFFHPHDSAATQARYFISTVQLEPGDLPPVLDIEVAEGVTPENIDKEIQVWLEMVHEAYGVQPVIYSGLHFIEENLHTGFNTYPLWLADYTETTPPAPGDWDSWTFWQQTNEEVIEGVAGTFDRSIHHGPAAHWEALLVPVAQ
ncbi:MAG TPA: GH25 family lysozyme [Rhodothermales bacterium]|nr:GH25 family lysozyme [Rhodothermales bacterium]